MVDAVLEDVGWTISGHLLIFNNNGTSSVTGHSSVMAREPFYLQIVIRHDTRAPYAVFLSLRQTHYRMWGGSPAGNMISTPVLLKATQWIEIWWMSKSPPSQSGCHWVWDPCERKYFVTKWYGQNFFPAHAAALLKLIGKQTTAILPRGTEAWCAEDTRRVPGMGQKWQTHSPGEKGMSSIPTSPSCRSAQSPCRFGSFHFPICRGCQ